MRKKKIVTIGGGTGSFTLLSGLKNFDFDISAIVSMSDDGGSTGRLRDELGVLPPGDVRQCLVALSKEPLIWRDLFNYRFDSGDLKGHAVGNIFLSGLEKMKGNFAEGLVVAEKALDVRGRVFPVTNDNVKLSLRLKSGRQIVGEAEINESDEVEAIGVEDIFLEPEAKVNPDARNAILNADVVVIGPGNHFCSILPNLLVSGITEAISQTKASVVYVANLVNKKGHTESFLLDEYIDSINYYIGEGRVDFVVFNGQKPSKKLSLRYQERGEVVIDFDEKSRKERKCKILISNLLGKPKKQSDLDELSETRSLIRHDSNKLAKIVKYIAELDEYEAVIDEII